MTEIHKHESMIIHQTTPYNAEAAPSQLVRSIITPNDLFFVRNHAPIPAFTADTYRLKIEGLVMEPLTLSLQDLRTHFEHHEVTATLQCAGNRRQELITVKPIPGEVPWNLGAIGTAIWGGVRLADVLNRAHVAAGAQHVAFLGADNTDKGEGEGLFGASIPLDKALSTHVLLAYEMNGEPLPPEHGYPLRVIVPGYIGARSVKWVTGITVQADPTSNYFRSRSYRLFPPHITREEANWDEGEVIDVVPPTAVILTPETGDCIAAGVTTIRGFALAFAGDLTGVEFSLDGGASWQPAEVVETAGEWAWVMWQTDVTLEAGTYEVVARVRTESGASGPEDVAAAWNFGGYGNAAYHRIRLDVG